MNKTIVRMLNINKVYDNGIVANNDAFLEITKGEIHAVAGENGAGKSTLMKILYGLERPSSGEIYIDEKKVDINSPVAADKLGIGMVHQHFMLVEELTVVENLILGKEQTKLGLIDKKAATTLLKRLSDEYSMPLNPNDKVSSLSIVKKQKLEILKVLSRNAQIIILDEPTAVLTPQETLELFKQLKILKSKGLTIIIITHKLKEIKSICDRITIMRNGRYIGTYQVKDISEQEISKLMVGRDVIRDIEKLPSKPGESVIKVNNITKISAERITLLNSLSFDLRKGEILCLAGIEGNGQKELINIITGLDNDYIGNVNFLGEDIKNKSVLKLRQMGQSHIPEDRIKSGMDILSSIEDNLISTKLDDVSRYTLINKAKTREISRKCIEDYQIKCDSKDQKAAFLSGGNMQKVVIARETSELPKLLVADQPTRGVDVGAIEFIHRKIIEMRDRGSAILLVSCDLSEVFSLSDRIIVLHKGEIVASISDIANLTEEEIGLYMLGLKRA